MTDISPEAVATKLTDTQLLTGLFVTTVFITSTVILTAETIKIIALGFEVLSEKGRAGKERRKRNEPMTVNL